MSKITDTYTKEEFLEIAISHMFWLASNCKRGKRAVFEKEVDMSFQIFDEVIDLRGATFEGDVNFSDATFEKYAYFSNASFKGYAYFADATFEKYAYFSNASFKGYADFSDATFEKYAYFSNASFKGYADFSDATFEKNADFTEAIFKKNVNFTGAKLKGKVITKGMKIRGHELEKTYEPDLLKKVYEQIKKAPETLRMDIWHSECGTTHCMAGWAVTLSKRGKALEKAVGTRVAGTLLLGIEASTYFVSSNKQVMSWLENKFEKNKE